MAFLSNKSESSEPMVKEEPSLEFEIVESVNAFNDQGTIIIELKGPRVNTEFPRVKRSLGSFTVSVAGCVLAKILNQPVFFKNEEVSATKIVCFYEVKS